MTSLSDRPPTAAASASAPHRHIVTEERPQWLVAALLVGAAAIHLAMAPAHLGESAVEGWGFLVSAWVQLGLAVALVLRPTRWALGGTVVSSIVLIAAWGVSRTAGLPFGHHAGHAESASLVDGACVALEAVAAVMAVAALLGRGQHLLARSTGAALIGAFGALAVTSAAIASPAARDHAAGSHGEPAAGHDHGGSELVAADGDAHAHSTGETTAASQAVTPAGHQHAEGDGGNVGVQNGDQEAELQPDQPLDSVTRAQLAAQLTQAREAALRYPTLADAQAAGMFPAGGFTPGAGAHYLSPGGAAASFLPGGTFDAANPATWIYDGDSPTSQVVGLMWISSEEEAPEGFAGPNDHWHRHFNTCIRSGSNGVAGIEVPFPADQDITKEMCDSVDGSFMESTVWMVHAWVVPTWESPNGVFSHDNPNLICADGTTDTDAAGFCQGT